MSPDEVRTARATLGEIYGLGRPLKASELGRLLRLSGRDPGRHILDLESGKHPASGPIIVALELMLAGGKPSHFAEAIPPKPGTDAPEAP